MADRPSAGQRLPLIPGFPQAQTYQQWQWQKQTYEQQQALTKQQGQPSAVRNTLMTMGMGFGMGMFVGGSVTLLHAVTSKQGINAATIKRAVAGGSAFGVIFAVGSLVRPH